MKVSMSLPAEDVAFLDEYARNKGFPSRSAALRRAIRLLRASELSADYAAAWDEWDQSSDEQLWDVAVGDGIVDR